jgi:hypothetical protein
MVVSQALDSASAPRDDRCEWRQPLLKQVVCWLLIRVNV